MKMRNPKYVAPHFEPALRKLSDGGYWISAPDFSPTGESEKIVKKSINDLKNSRSTVINAKYLVIDVRGNNGGSSMYGERIANTLWGSDLVESYRPQSTGVDWRISKKNIEHVDWIIPNLKQKGATEENIHEFKSIVENMKISEKKGNPFYFQKGEVPNKVNTAIKNEVKTKIYFLTSAGCASAYLDFADIILSMPNVTHLGRETSADTNYLEVSFRTTPSGLFKAVYPRKVYRGRQRGDNKPYTPGIKWTGDIFDTIALEKWIKNLPNQ